MAKHMLKMHYQTVVWAQILQKNGMKKEIKQWVKKEGKKNRRIYKIYRWLTWTTNVYERKSWRKMLYSYTKFLLGVRV